MLHVEVIDLLDFGLFLFAIAMMGQFVMSFGDSDLRVTFVVPFVTEHESQNSRRVASDRQCRHIHHQFAMLAPIARDPGGACDVGHSVFTHFQFVGMGHAVLDISNGIQVFVKLPFVSGTKPRLKSLRIIEHEVEDAFTSFDASGPILSFAGGVTVAKQAIKNR